MTSSNIADIDFDWHGMAITRATMVDGAYKNTQNVRRFLRLQCGEDFTFDRAFMAGIRDGAANSMGDVADEWLRRRQRAPHRHD